VGAKENGGGTPEKHVLQRSRRKDGSQNKNSPGEWPARISTILDEKRMVKNGQRMSKKQGEESGDINSRHRAQLLYKQPGICSKLKKDENFCHRIKDGRNVNDATGCKTRKALDPWKIDRKRIEKVKEHWGLEEARRRALD